jgi:6-phosphogluconolactonase
VAGSIAGHMLLGADPGEPAAFRAEWKRRLLLLLALVLGLYAQFAGAVPRYAYAVNYFGGSISIYRVDAETGMLYHQSHVPTFKSPSTLILHPSGKFLYVASQTIDQIAIYRVDSQTGALAEIPQSPVAAGVRSAFQLAVSPDGRYLYVPGRFTYDVAVFKIDQASGALSPLLDKTLPTHGERARFIETTPDGRFLYVSNTFSNNIAAFKVDAKRDHITPVAGMPFAAGDAPQAAMAHPNGKFLYVANWRSATISSYAIDQASGSLTPLPGTPVETGYFPFSGGVHPSGDFLYVANWGTSDVSGFRIDPQSGALTPLPGMPVTTGGIAPVTIAFDAAGRFAYVPNHDDVSLTLFQVDAATGRLQQPHRIYTRPGVRRLAILEGTAPVQVAPGFLLLTDTATGTIASYGLAPATGDLRLLSKQPLGKAPGAVAISPAGDFVYAIDAARNAIVAYGLDAAGKLTPVAEGEAKVEGKLRDLRINHRGSHLYAVTDKPDRYLAFAIDAKSGKLTLEEGVNLPDGSQPQRVLGSPEERLGFVLDETNSRLFTYRYLETAGPLTYEMASRGSPFNVIKHPVDMVVDPTGLNALVLGQAGGLAVYRLPTVWGPLKPLGDGPIPAGQRPVAVAVHPRGGFVYVADAGTSTLRQFRLDADSGALQPVGKAVALAAVPAALHIEPSGRFAYVTYAAKTGLTRFEIDPASGRLVRPQALLDGVDAAALAVSAVIR